MPVPAALSFTTTVVGVLLALLTYGMSAAPGWRELRWFSAVAASAAGFTACNAFTTLPVDEGVIGVTSRISVLLAGLHGAAWFAYGAAQERRALRPLERAVVVVGILLGVAALVPGVVNGAPLVARAVPWLGVVYRDATPTTFGHVAYCYFCGALLWLTVRYARAWARGALYAAAHAAGLAVVTAAAVHDSFATTGVIAMPYLLDASFLVLVLAVGGVITSRFVAAARALEVSSSRLAETQAALLRRERLAALGELSAVVAHEVRNPLAVIFNAVAALKRQPAASADAAQLVSIVDEEAARLKQLVDDLLSFARPEQLRLEPTAVRELLEGAVAASRADGRASALTIEVDAPAGMPELTCDRRLVQQAIFNLVHNAVQAARTRVRVEAGLAGASAVRVTVTDDGVGVPAEVRTRIFTPFFTTRPTGTGLGLVLVRRVAEAHGGDVVLDEGQHEGAAFVLRLPLVPPRASASAL